MSKWREFLFNGCILAGVALLSLFVYFYSKGGDCPIGTVLCTINGVCIPRRSMCNLEIDCPDGEDEEPVVCAELIGSTDLTDRILNISLNDNRINITYNSQFECDIENYPIECTCVYSTRIYCNHGQFNEIPRNISKEITHLVIRNNSIKILKTDSLENYNLTLLHLASNGLTIVESGVFLRQKHLERLFLMYNKLEYLPINVFSGLEKLEWLHIDGNFLEEINLEIFQNMEYLLWLNMSNNGITLDKNQSFPLLPGLLDLYLGHNKIKTIRSGTFSLLPNLSLLVLGYNEIEVIEMDAFKNLKRLKELDLSNNKLRNLHGNLFTSQVRLEKLVLGYNAITSFQINTFSKLKNLKSLHLEATEISNIDTKLFANMNKLQWLFFKYYTYCTFAPFVPRCRPLSDGISSINQLLSKPIFRYSNWIICLITLCGNSLVLFSRFLFRDENRNLSIVIKNLAVSDFLMGIYLLIIAYHDLMYRDNYNEAAREWISSWKCIFTGMIGITSLEVSVLFMVFLSVDRYLVITKPYKNYGFLSINEMWRIIIIIWSFGISTSLIPAIGLISSTKFYGVNGLCLPLFIDDPYLIGWEYSAIIFFGINGPSLLIIIYTYTGMFLNIKNTRNATSNPLNDCQFAIRFFFIVIANVACWLPIIIAKMLVYFTIEISADVYAWLVVFVLPINSSFNPILYTFTTRKYRQRIFKMPQWLKKLTKPKNSTISQIQSSGNIFRISFKDIVAENKD